MTIDDADAVQVPTIIIPGMTFSDFYLYDENGENMRDSNGNIMRSDMMITDSAEVSAAVKGLIKPLIKSVLFQRDKGLSESVYSFISTLFKYQKNNPDGTGVYDVRVKTFDHSLAQMTQQEKDYYLRLLPLHSYGRIFGEENVYIYTYYMYGDVIKQGDALQDYIEMVKAQRNCDKVNIVTMSMGTTILNAWLDNDRADYSSINRLINIVPIYQGCDLITDVFARDFNLTDQFVYQDYLPIVTKGFLENEYLGYLLNIAIKLLPQKTFERVLTRLTDAFVEALKNSSQMWSMIASDSYEKLADKYFSEPEYAKLRATTN